MNNVIRAEYGQFERFFRPSIIVDAGAYIGDTSAYFLSRFPGSHVIALEPNDESYQLAVRNLRPYGARASLLKIALWVDRGPVRIGGSQTGATVGTSGCEVAAETIDSLMERLGIERIDLLKMDIEGAESRVIPSGVGTWLRRVGRICLETHGDDIELMLIPLLRRERFQCRRFRNVWYCIAQQ